MARLQLEALPPVQGLLRQAPDGLQAESLRQGQARESERSQVQRGQPAAWRRARGVPYQLDARHDRGARRAPDAPAVLRARPVQRGQPRVQVQPGASDELQVPQLEARAALLLPVAARDAPVQQPAAPDVVQARLPGAQRDAGPRPEGLQPVARQQAARDAVRHRAAGPSAAPLVHLQARRARARPERRRTTRCRRARAKRAL